MGLFSDEEKRIVNAFADSQPLIKKEDYTDTLLEFIISGIRHDEEDIPENILASMFAGFPNAVRKYLRYGTKYYAYPPPTGVFTTVNSNDRATLQKVITSIYGQYAYIDSMSAGMPDWNFYARKRMWQSGWVDAAGDRWRPESSTITLLTTRSFQNSYHDVPHINGQNHGWTTPNFLEGTMVAAQTGYQPPSQSSGGINYGSAVITGSHLEIYFTVKYERQAPSDYAPSTVQDRVIVDRIPLAQISPEIILPSSNGVFDPTYYGQVIYQVVVGFTNNPDRFEFWDYNQSKGLYPLHGLTKARSPFVPITILKMDSKAYWQMGDHVKSTTEKLTKKLQLNARKVYDALEKEIPGQLPKGANYTDAFIEFGLDPDPKIKAHCKYVIEYVKALTPDRSRTQITHKDLLIAGAGNAGYVFNIEFTAEYSRGAPNFPVLGASTGSPQDYHSVFSYHGENVYLSKFEVWYTVNEAGRLYSAKTDRPYLPINQAVLKKLNGRAQEAVLQAAARVTVLLTHVEKIKIKWYQKSIFQVLFVIITIVVVIFTAQIQLVGWAITVMGTAISIQALLLKLAVSFLISFTSNYVLGGELGMLFGLVMSFYMGGGFSGMQGLSVTSLWNNLFSFKGLGNIISAINTVTDLYIQKQSYVIKGKMEAMQYEHENYMLSMKEKQEDLEAKYYNLGGRGALSGLEIVSKGNSAYYPEHPDNFYARTTRTNPGGELLDLLRRFHDLALDLPKDRLDNPMLSLNEMPTPGVS